MKKNIGTTDRILRLVFAAAVAILYFANLISGTIAVVLGLVAVIFLLTSAMGFCPLYFPFKISTLKKSAS